MTATKRREAGKSERKDPQRMIAAQRRRRKTDTDEEGVQNLSRWNIHAVVVSRTKSNDTERHYPLRGQ